MQPGRLKFKDAPAPLYCRILPWPFTVLRRITRWPSCVARLARVARGGLVSVAEAAEALGESRARTSRTLAKLARRGWVERARRGLYLVRPLEVAPGERTVAEDPWVVADEVFGPCYIGGWSAAEYWNLTEQIFREILVVTAASVRSQVQDLLGHTFRLFRVPESRISGSSLTRVWRGAARVRVSSPERTIADGLRNPELCGGIRHLGDIMREYGRREDYDTRRLAEAMDAAATGAAWKRLGYLAEMLWPGETGLLSLARKNASKGNARLDPSVDGKGRLVNRWRLWVNVSVDAGDADMAP